MSRCPPRAGSPTRRAGPCKGSPYASADRSHQIPAVVDHAVGLEILVRGDTSWRQPPPRVPLFHPDATPTAACVEHGALALRPRNQFLVPRRARFAPAHRPHARGMSVNNVLSHHCHRTAPAFCASSHDMWPAPSARHCTPLKMPTPLHRAVESATSGRVRLQQVPRAVTAPSRRGHVASAQRPRTPDPATASVVTVADWCSVWKLTSEPYPTPAAFVAQARTWYVWRATGRSSPRQNVPSRCARPTLFVHRRIPRSGSSRFPAP